MAKYNTDCEFNCEEGYLYYPDGSDQKCLCKIEQEAEVDIAIALGK